MQFNVAQLLKEPTGATRRYELVEDVSELDPELTMLGPMVGTLNLIRTHSGVLVRAELSSAVQVTCNRCLEPIALPVRFRFEESYRPLTEVNTGRYLLPEEFEGTTEELEDEALIIDEHHILDITEVVRQNIWLAMPMYPACIWPQPEACPNWLAYTKEMEQSQAGGGKSEEEVDPRWSALLKLKGKLDTTGQG